MSNLAIKIEREVLGENVGCQDQIFSSFGGFNCIRFKSDVDFSVENLINNKKILNKIEKILGPEIASNPCQNSRIKQPEKRCFKKEFK